ncbi:hypothetical protein N9L20_06115 [Flavobacteriaceae bacterium]|nr:hypothetical protein [Flavobacteriaceae bacterium]
MKNVKNIFINSVLSLLFLVSTGSYALNSHVCGGEKVDFELFAEAAGCGMENEIHESHDFQGFYQRPCCKNESEIIESNFKDFHAISSLVLPELNFDFELPKRVNFVFQKENIKPIFGKDPPIIELNHQLSYLQIFRI